MEGVIHGFVTRVYKKCSMKYVLLPKIAEVLAAEMCMHTRICRIKLEMGKSKEIYACCEDKLKH